MINPFEMVILIVLIVTIGKVLMSRRARHHREVEDHSPEDRLEALRLKDEVRQLKERIHVLERIATDKEDSLSREIDRLRDR